MKRGVLLSLLLFVFLSASFAFAQVCDYDPDCIPNIRSCGCGGTQTRYTLCEGGCSDWYPCSVADSEADCDDGLDDDCDGLIDCDDPDCAPIPFCIDEDGDSFPLSVDCDDTDPEVNPEAAELCNLVDDNCDGTVDEGCTCTPEGSEKACSTDTGVCTRGVQTCLPDGTWSGCDGVLPRAEDCDGLDNDCDGSIDEGCECIDGATEPCGSDIGACEFGSRSCTDGLWSSCSGGVTPVDEVCGNGIDDNCDGEVDESCPADEPEGPVPAPGTGPETGPETGPGPAPEPEPDLPVATRECVDEDGDGYGRFCARGFDCDDEDASIFPGAPEVCNDRDDDCDTMVDELVTRDCGVSDIGVCTFGVEQCDGGEWHSCSAVFPSDEVCGNRLDDDCDGSVDEGCEDPLAADELALKQFLDIKLGEGAYDLDAYLQKKQDAELAVNVRKTSSVVAGRTRVRLELVPVKKLYNLTVFEYIPKSLAQSADLIVFSVEPEVIQDDPLVAWHFSELSEKTDLSYGFAGEVHDAADKTSTVPVADRTEPIVRPWYFSFLPLLIIPILGFVFVLLVDLAHRRRR